MERASSTPRFRVEFTLSIGWSISGGIPRLRSKAAKPIPISRRVWLSVHVRGPVTSFGSACDLIPAFSVDYGTVLMSRACRPDSSVVKTSSRSSLARRLVIWRCITACPTDADTIIYDHRLLLLPGLA